MKLIQCCGVAVVVLGASLASAQYQVVSVANGGTIRGTVKWEGPVPRLIPSVIDKDQQVCDPLGQKHRDLERLGVSHDSGVANTVVFLKDITKGKAMELPQPRQVLNQKNCRYEPHILLVPLNGSLEVKSSDPLLHTVHMSGSSDYNLPFTSQGQTMDRVMNRAGEVSLRCNAGHVWMNAEMIVVPHPYYAVTDENGVFELTNVPPGDYEIVAWHEGWRVVGETALYDLATQVRVKRPVFSDSVTWSKHVSLPANGRVELDFAIGEHSNQVATVH